jgi:hypothetical protein
MPRHAKRLQRGKAYRRRAKRGLAARLSVAPRSASRTLRQNAKGYVKALTGFPNEMRVVLPYAENSRINPGAVYGYDSVYNGNSVFDPENTGVGHQPRGFDQWAAVYNQYRVNKVTVVYEVRQRASHGIQGYIVANNDSGGLGTNNEVAEYNTAINIGSTSSNVMPLRGKRVFWPHKILGLSWAQYIANENTAALVTANPAEVAYIHLIAQQIDETTACDYEQQTCWYFDVTFFDRKNIAIS